MIGSVSITTDIYFQEGSSFPTKKKSENKIDLFYFIFICKSLTFLDAIGMSSVTYKVSNKHMNYIIFILLYSVSANKNLYYSLVDSLLNAQSRLFV
jgi:hypothetical protein